MRTLPMIFFAVAFEGLLALGTALRLVRWLMS